MTGNNADFPTVIRLKWKFTLVIVGITLAMGLLTTLFIEKTVVPALKHQFMERLVSISRNLAADCLNPLLINDRSRLQDLLDNTKTSEADVVYAYVLDGAHQVVAHTFERDLPADLAGLNAPPPDQTYTSQLLDTDQGYIRDIAVPLLASHGLVHVGITESHLRRHLREIRQALLLLTAALGLIGFLVALLVDHFVTKPLKTLTQGVIDIGQGDLKKRLPVKTHDEIGALTASFNKMAVELDTLAQQRRQMADLVVQAKNEWEEAFDTINDAITIHDNDWNIIRANKAAAEMLGVPLPVILNEKCHKSYHGTICPPQGCPSCQSLISGIPSVTELFEPHLNKYLEIKALPRFGPARQIIGVVHIVRDITARKTAELEQEKLRNQILQAQKMETVGQLAGGVAHDFNNILSVIIGYSSLALLEIGGGPLRDKLQLIKESGEKAAALTRQLLAFSRKQVLEVQILNLNTLVDNMAKMLGRMIGEDMILELKTKTPTSRVKADSAQIEQILMNLAVNARDAMPAGGHFIIELTDADLGAGYTRYHQEAKPGKYVLLTVSDSGSGMSPDVQERIFEPFFTTKAIGKGTGLGLSTVFGIVKQHNGYIDVFSKIGRGTTFKIYLPATTGEALEKVEPLESFALAHGTETVLVVDDNKSIRTLVIDTLRNWGYTMLEAGNGAEALELSASHAGKIHLLLTDVIMPGMNGRALAETFKTMRPETKVVFMSGYTLDAVAQHGVPTQGLAFVQKPLTLEKLAKTIRAALN